MPLGQGKDRPGLLRGLRGWGKGRPGLLGGLRGRRKDRLGLLRELRLNLEAKGNPYLKGISVIALTGKCG